MFYSNQDPPAGKQFAMAYARSGPTARTAAPGGTRVWEDLRKEARRLEGEIDVKLAAFTKLCSSFEASYKLNSADNSLGADQLSQTKAAELEDLLQRLSDVNDEMGGVVGGSSDARSHTLARHRDILQEYSQEFRKVNSTLSAARDRLKLLAGSSLESPLLSVQVQSSTGALLRERGSVQNSTNMVDDLLAQAGGVHSNLMQQRRLFDNIGDKLMAVGARFPVVNGLMNAIRRKKSKDTLVLSGVIAACVVFTVIYVLAK